LRPAAAVEDRVLEEDVRTLTRALEDEGFATAHVEAEVPEGGGMLPVVYRVRSGPRTLVSEVVVDRTDAPGAPAQREQRLASGKPYRARDVALERADQLALLRNAGYLQSEVTPEVSFTDDRSGARIRMRVAAGPRTDVDHVVISGLTRTHEQVVRRELLFEEGSPLGLQKVLESQRRLAGLGIFESVSVDQMDPESVGKRSLIVNAVEGRRLIFAYGVGYAEQDSVRGSIEVTRRNLGGLDRSLSTFLRASARGNRLLTTYSEPYLFGHKQALFVTGFRESEERQGFDFIRYGGLVQTARSFDSRFSLILRYTYQRTHVFHIQVDLSGVDRQFRNSTISGPSVSIFQDTRDDPLDPRRGRFLGADVQLSSRVLGADGFLKGFLQGSTYRRLSGRATLALNGQLGLAHSVGYDTSLRLPLPDRFFAGGDYSLRGFKLDTAGPLEQPPLGDPIPTGGNALIVASAELRFDAGRHFSLAGFTDVGNVFPLVSDFDLGQLRYTAGLGLRYRSALGPLRVDWGYKLNRRANELPYKIHLTIGHAF
jgi:outer membrane protein insertion porin family